MNLLPPIDLINSSLLLKFVRIDSLSASEEKNNWKQELKGSYCAIDFPDLQVQHCSYCAGDGTHSATRRVGADPGVQRNGLPRASFGHIHAVEDPHPRNREWSFRQGQASLMPKAPLA